MAIANKAILFSIGTCWAKKKPISEDPNSKLFLIILNNESLIATKSFALYPPYLSCEESPIEFLHKLYRVGIYSFIFFSI